MKKILMFGLALLLSVVLPLNARAAEAADLVGEWYGSMYGIVMVLTLGEDGSFTMAMPGMDEALNEDTAGKWHVEGDQLIIGTEENGEDASSMTIGDGTLTLSEDGVEVVFTREPIDVFTPADPKTDAALEEYSGKWQASMVSIMGITLAADEMEMDLRAEIDGGNITLNSTSLDIADQKAECEFQDGALVMDLTKSLNEAMEALEGTEAAAEMEETEAEGSTGYSFQLLTDGSLKASMSAFGMEVIFYMDQVEEFTIPEPAEETTEEAA